MTLAAGSVTIIAITHGNRPTRSTIPSRPRTAQNFLSVLALSFKYSLSLFFSCSRWYVSFPSIRSSFSLCAILSSVAMRRDAAILAVGQRHLFSPRASYSKSEKRRKKKKKKNCENSRQRQLPFWKEWQLATAEIASRN